jgi:hypothetical protein
MTFVNLGAHDTIVLLLSIAAAFLLALPIGWERKTRSEAYIGLRVFPLVSVSACVYAILGQHLFTGDDSKEQSDVLQGLMTGIGFIGAGAIMKKPTRGRRGVRVPLAEPIPLRERRVRCRRAGPRAPGDDDRHRVHRRGRDLEAREWRQGGPGRHDRDHRLDRGCDRGFGRHGHYVVAAALSLTSVLVVQISGGSRTALGRRGPRTELVDTRQVAPQSSS